MENQCVRFPTSTRWKNSYLRTAEVYRHAERKRGELGSGGLAGSEGRTGRRSTHCISGGAKPQHGGHAYGLTVETFIGKQTPVCLITRMEVAGRCVHCRGLLRSTIAAGDRPFDPLERPLGNGPGGRRGGLCPVYRTRRIEN